MKKLLKFKTKEVKLWERRGFWQTLQIHPDKTKWGMDEYAMLTILTRLMKRRTLPKNHKEIAVHMAMSYQNSSRAFQHRRKTAILLDIEHVIKQLI